MFGEQILLVVPCQPMAHVHHFGHWSFLRSKRCRAGPAPGAGVSLVACQPDDRVHQRQTPCRLGLGWRPRRTHGMAATRIIVQPMVPLWATRAGTAGSSRRAPTRSCWRSPPPAGPQARAGHGSCEESPDRPHGGSRGAPHSRTAPPRGRTACTPAFRSPLMVPTGFDSMRTRRRRASGEHPGSAAQPAPGSDSREQSDPHPEVVCGAQ